MRLRGCPYIPFMQKSIRRSAATALGAVIGHEMTHGFDDQGRQFAAAGNLRDWWTAQDASAYKTRAQLVSDQFDRYTILDSATYVNGKLTLGENIADLGGLTIAYAALWTARQHAGIRQGVRLQGRRPDGSIRRSAGPDLVIWIT